MFLSKAQQERFWREWKHACNHQGWTAANGWDKAKIDSARHTVLRRIGFESLTQVDRNDGYTALLRELAILRDDLSGIMAAESNPRRILLFSIRKLALRLSPSQVDSAPLGSGYLGAIMMDRYGHLDIERITDLEELTKLRDTLADRLVEEHKPETLARRNAQRRQRRSQANPPARINLPAPAPDDHDPYELARPSTASFPSICIQSTPTDPSALAPILAALTTGADDNCPF